MVSLTVEPEVAGLAVIDGALAEAPVGCAGDPVRASTAAAAVVGAGFGAVVVEGALGELGVVAGALGELGAVVVGGLLFEAVEEQPAAARSSAAAGTAMRRRVLDMAVSLLLAGPAAEDVGGDLIGHVGAGEFAGAGCCGQAGGIDVQGLVVFEDDHVPSGVLEPGVA